MSGQRVQLLLKRVFDVTASIPLLILFAVPLGLAMAAIRLEGGGATLFRQQRVGLYGRTFRIWKLRTMTETRIAPQAPDRLTHDDPRITRVGRVLRGLGIDELPQLVNVLSGEMSLVGPRPTLAYQVAAYDDFQRRRLEVKPGITSMAVVSGRNALPWVHRIELDIWYIDHWSLGLDLRILLRTLWCLLVRRTGLYGDDGINDSFVEEPKQEPEADVP